MAPPGGLALVGWRVLAVVDRQVEVVEVDERIGAMVLELAEGDLEHVLEGPEVRLVVVRGARRVGEPG